MGPKPPASGRPASSKPATKSRVKQKQAKAAPTDAERLKRLFTSLCAQIDGGYFTNALKTCDKGAFLFDCLAGASCAVGFLEY